jgi:hypothetical protein
LKKEHGFVKQYARECNGGRSKSFALDGKSGACTREDTKLRRIEEREKLKLQEKYLEELYIVEKFFFLNDGKQQWMKKKDLYVSCYESNISMPTGH